MNDPYKSQRLELCKQQTMLHKANCDGCSKIYGINDGAIRYEHCNKCYISKELRSLGKELIKYSRPRRKMPIKNIETQMPLRKRPPLDESKIKPFKTLREKGVTIAEVGRRWGYEEKAIRNFAKKYGIETPRARKLNIFDNLSLEQYLELKQKYKSDRKLSSVIGYSYASIYHFKKHYGLVKGAV